MWRFLNPLSRATDKARKSVITHWKTLKTHWKYKLGVKIRISILRYALGVQCSAYWLSIHVLKKVKLWIVDVNLSVRLSSYCQNTVNIYSSVITSKISEMQKSFWTSRSKLGIWKIMPVQIIKCAVIFCNLCQSEWNYASQNRLTCYFQHHWVIASHYQSYN